MIRKSLFLLPILLTGQPEEGKLKEQEEQEGEGDRDCMAMSTQAHAISADIANWRSPGYRIPTLLAKHPAKHKNVRYGTDAR